MAILLMKKKISNNGVRMQTREASLCLFSVLLPNSVLLNLLLM